MMFGEIASAFSLWDRFSRLWKNKNSVMSESIATRFVRVFESHGIHRNQIPRFFGYGLAIADVKDDDTLLLKLTEEMLNSVCDMFAIRREWLDGADNQIYPLHDFYKQPQKFIEFIESLNNRKGANLSGFLLISKSKQFNDDALMILEESISSIGDRSVYRYHFCNNLSYKYWKSRTYLTACIASAWKRKIHIRGRIVSQAYIDKHYYGGSFLEHKNRDYPLPPSGKLWHPEDLALEPEIFLEEIYEGKEYANSSALQLWMSLAEKGLMDIGLNSNEAKEKFQKALVEHNSQGQKLVK